MATRVTGGASSFARLAASSLPRACIALTKSEEKERLLAVYIEEGVSVKRGVVVGAGAGIGVYLLF